MFADCMHRCVGSQVHVWVGKMERIVVQDMVADLVGTEISLI